MPAGEQREILSSLGVFFDSMTAEITRTGSLDESFGGATARMLQTFFKWNGLNWWTETLRGSAALSMSHNLALNAGRAFGELAPQLPGDIVAALWEKFLFIAPFSGVGAVTRMPAGLIRSVPESRDMLETAMREVFDLARARGIGLRKDAVSRTMAYVDGLPAEGTASMQRDILEGRPSELDYQTGAIVRLGRESGVPVPVNDFIYRSLLPGERRASDGGLRMS